MTQYNLTSNTPLIKSPDNLHVLCLGDVVGRSGRKALRDCLPELRQRLVTDMIICNGENAAGGIGLTPETASELFHCGVDVITSGNHIWKHKSILPTLDKNCHVLRPANYPEGAPGKGLCIFTLPCGTQIAVLNLLGRVYMDAVDCPFRKAQSLLSTLPESVKIRIVDFHAEASSEKRAMAHFLDSKTSAVLGTHTHVQTADAFVSALGTASLTDLGMCGAEEESVIGMHKKTILERFYSGLPRPFIPANNPGTLNGALLCIEKISGKALSIALVRHKMPEYISV